MAPNVRSYGRHVNRHTEHRIVTHKPDNSTPPKLRVRYFYYSDLVIDDSKSPLLPKPAEPKAKPPARPFSVGDNETLDREWIELRNATRSAESRTGSRAGSRLSSRLGTAQHQKPRSGSLRRTLPTHPRDGTPPIDIQPGSAASHSGFIYTRTSDNPEDDVRPLSSVRSGFSSKSGTSGKPLIRIPDRRDTTSSSVGTPIQAHTQPQSAGMGGASSAKTAAAAGSNPAIDSAGPGTPTATSTTSDSPKSTKNVPVGVSRLHHVVMSTKKSNLKMDPIYWKPIDDTAAVVRGTWFFRDTMTPVDPATAILLEAGYLERRVWTPTWQELIKSAVKVGPVAERKMIMHPLWPSAPQSGPTSPHHQSDSSTRDPAAVPEESDDLDLEQDLIVAAARRRIEAIVSSDDVDHCAAGSASAAKDTSRQQRKFRDCQVLYVNPTTAFILQPNQAPAEGSRRRPLADLVWYRTIPGVAVVRGFDPDAWDNLARKEQRPDAEFLSASSSPPPLPEVTDLVLVIHGIGQKLSEQIESFHFTRAINSFRQSVNAARAHPGVEPHLRPDVGGIMVLPVNWRNLLSFDPDEVVDPDTCTTADPADNKFGLNDITPSTIRPVRDFVSKVILDIPYYLSPTHHPKMVQATIEDANRIYRQWCGNNRTFQKSGRVHVLAHSLGSGLAIDILSNQPTWVPELPESDPMDHFSFNTKSLFLCGSPAGFFLLLKSASLRPRSDVAKPGAGSAMTPGVAGKQGDYGCVAADNVFNVINPYDPVAYRLNGCVDAQYARSLQPAVIPREIKSTFDSFVPFWHSKPSTGLFASSTRAQAETADGPTASTTPTTTTKPDLPPIVELDKHNFSRMMIAEKRAHFLNDYGQIDFFMTYTGGFFNIRYLTMLNAHSSYWTSDDFIRFLVVEIGRRPGRAGCLPCLKAVKNHRVVEMPTEDSPNVKPTSP